MLKTRLLHPEILRVLGGAGHSSQVLIADGNFPFVTQRGPNAEIVFLNLAPDMPSATQVLDVLRDAIPIEAAAVMKTADGSVPPIHKDFAALLPDGVQLRSLERFAFYDAVHLPQTALIIATGESRVYANLLLTIGVVEPA